MTADANLRPLIVGIGVPRGGSTWLASLIARHSSVIEPSLRKEVRFFDRFYSRGTAWYEHLFASGDPRGLLIGLDFSPQYMYSPEALGRLRSWHGPVRVTAVLRAPWHRSWSDYNHVARITGSTEPFGVLSRQFPAIIERSRYTRYLTPWMEILGEDSVSIFVLEELQADPESSAATVYRALRLPIEGGSGPAPLGESRNAAFVPRSRRLYRGAMLAKRTLIGTRYSRVLAVGKTPLVSKLLRSNYEPPPLPGRIRDELQELFATEVGEVECLLGRRLPWNAESFHA